MQNVYTCGFEEVLKVKPITKQRPKCPIQLERSELFLIGLSVKDDMLVYFDQNILHLTFNHT